MNHAMDMVTTSPFAFNPVCGWVAQDTRIRTKLIVGNDVWIGANAIILPNVTEIGDGAIVGAGSIVTKNVPEYAIVGGNPAKLIRYRYFEEMRSKMRASQWWTLTELQLSKMMPLFSKPEEFVEEVEWQKGKK